MIDRFCAYSVLKNLRLIDPFLVIYLIGSGFPFVQIGGMLACGRIVTALFEIPSGYWADRFGRRTVLACSFAAHAIGLAGFGIAAAGDAPNVIVIYFASAIYGFGEALRTGSHKAMMLDYLELHGRKSESTAVLSTTRTFSKSTSAAAGLTAGVLLYCTSSFALLVWLSAAAAVAGMFLIAGYPKELEGEIHRQEFNGEGGHRFVSRFKMLLSNRKLWPLIGRSLVFESQVEIVNKFFLRAFLEQGLRSLGLPAWWGDGAANHGGTVVVGGNELLRDSLGALGAKSSKNANKWRGSRVAVMRAVYMFTACAMAIGYFAAGLGGWSFWIGILSIGAIAFLQNLRRPIFVTEINEHVDKPMRSTLLSIESQLRSLTVAVLMPLFGYAADLWGIEVILLFSVLLTASVAVSATRTDSPRGVD